MVVVVVMTAAAAAAVLVAITFIGHGKLAVAEQEIASGAEGEDFLTLAQSLRERVHGKL